MHRQVGRLNSSACEGERCITVKHGMRNLTLTVRAFTGDASLSGADAGGAAVMLLSATAGELH
jgi:hypothetical protein